MGESTSGAGNQLALKKQLNYAEIEQIGKAFVASGMFGRDLDRTSKAITKIMAGQELGLAPFASMRAIHVIEGNATLSANTMAGMVKSSRRYDYKIIEKSMEKCSIEFIEKKGTKTVSLGTETFDMKEAEAARLTGKDNWKKYPKAMLFARCISNGTRTYCPDVFSGMLVYTPDELNARVNDAGDVIDINPKTGDVEQTKSKEQTPSKREQEAVDPEIDQSVPEDIDTPDFAEGDDGIQQEPEELDEPDFGDDLADAVVEPVKDEPELVVDDEMKEATWGLYDTLMIKHQYKLKLLKDTTGVLGKSGLKEDKQWIDLYNRVIDISTGEEDVPENWRQEKDDA